MEAVKTIVAALAVVALGVGAVVTLGVVAALTALLVMTAKLWFPVLLVLLALAAVVTVVCCVANGQEG